jgi:Bax protein
MEIRDPYVLVSKLDHYSEKGSVYGEELSAITRFNHFDSYDKWPLVGII